jgi:hypothetical protein
MRRRLAYVLAPLAVLGISAAVISGCGQGIGEKCQVDSDCTSGLCNTGTGLCQAQGTKGFDSPVPDAHPIDSAIDAKPVDAMPDAMPDAKI